MGNVTVIAPQGVARKRGDIQCSMRVHLPPLILVYGASHPAFMSYAPPSAPLFDGPPSPRPRVQGGRAGRLPAVQALISSTISIRKFFVGTLENPLDRLGARAPVGDACRALNKG